MATVDGKKTGGRVKGTLNKRSQAVSDLLEELGCDPIRGLAEIAMNSAEESLRFQANKELSQYIAPKLKSIEHKGSDTQPLRVESVFRPYVSPAK